MAAIAHNDETAGADTEADDVVGAVENDTAGAGATADVVEPKGLSQDTQVLAVLAFCT